MIFPLFLFNSLEQFSVFLVSEASVHDAAVDLQMLCVTGDNKGHKERDRPFE
jgi:hypothetical protein